MLQIKYEEVDVVMSTLTKAIRIQNNRICAATHIANIIYKLFEFGAYAQLH